MDSFAPPDAFEVAEGYFVPPDAVEVVEDFFTPSDAFETVEGHHVFEALKKCIFLGTEPLEAAHDLDRTPVERSRRLPAGISRSHRRFWLAFLEIVRQLPYDHDGQRKLVEIIWHLTSLPAHSPEIPPWSTLPEFDYLVRDLWRRPMTGGENGIFYQRWVSLNAFAARFYARFNTSEWYDLGITSVRDAFELDFYPSWGAKACYTDAAAQWMIYSAPKLFHLTRTSNRHRQVFYPGGGYITLENPECYGRTIITLARWIYWKVEFNNRSEDGFDQPYTAYTYMSNADGDAGLSEIMHLLKSFDEDLGGM